MRCRGSGAGAEGSHRVASVPSATVFDVSLVFPDILRSATLEEKIGDGDRNVRSERRKAARRRSGASVSEKWFIL